MRLHYWSESDLIKRIRKHFSLEEPEYATWEEWDELEKRFRKDRPVIHWLTDTGVDKLQDIVYFVPDKIKQFKQATIWKFFRNLWLFRKCLWNYRSWDYYGMMMFMETCARDMSVMHKEHGITLNSEETAKELLVFAELLKRIREDEYVDKMVDWKELEEGEKGGVMGVKPVQRPNTLPNYHCRTFYRMRSDVRKNDLRLAAKLFERKVLTWWE